MFQYFFYKLYIIADKRESKWGDSAGIAHIIAMVLISILIFLNLMTIFVLVNQIASFSFSFEKIHGVIIAIFLYVIIYFSFLNDRKYLTLVEKYDLKSYRYKLLMNTLFYVYIVVSVLSFFIVLETFATNKV
jgi:lysylphosphatidylglycerol synthetase-like protein (DUF2156 family)